MKRQWINHNYSQCDPSFMILETKCTVRGKKEKKGLLIDKTIKIKDEREGSSTFFKKDKWIKVPLVTCTWLDNRYVLCSLYRRDFL